MSEKRAFVKAASAVAVITAFSRVLGLARDSVVAAFLGAQWLNDVFQIAFELPNLARRVLGEGSLSAFIVPLFSAEKRENGERDAWRFAANALTTITLVSAVLTILGCLFAKPLFLIFGGFGMMARSGGEEEAILLGARLTRIMFPYLMLLAMAALLMGLCHARRRFVAPAFGSVLINLTMIGAGGLFWLLHHEGLAASENDPVAAALWQTRFTYWLAGAVLIGITLRVLVHVPSLWAEGFRFIPTLKLRHPRLVELFRKMPMAVAGMAVAHLMISINMIFATFMNEGFATQLRYSNRLIQLPLGILASAMATAIIPQLVLFFQEDRRDELRSLFGFAMRLTVILFLPATVGLIVLGRPIVGLLFERMAWDATATDGTCWALLFYSIGLLPAAGLRLVIPLYYARLDLRSPVKAGIAAVALNIALNVAFYFTPLRQGGLALATSLAMTANLALLLYWMRQSIAGTMDRRLAETLIKGSIAAAIMGFALWAALVGFERTISPLTTFGSRAVFVGCAIPLGIAVYFATAALLRTPDLGRAFDVVRKRLKKDGLKPK